MSVNQRIAKQLRKDLQRVEDDARANASGRVVKRRTGQLARGLTSGAKVDGRNVVGHVGKRPSSHAFYLRFFEFTGRRAFTIRPRRAKALRIGGGFVKGPVEIPAMGKRPIIRPALSKHEPRITRGIRRAFSDQAVEDIVKTARTVRAIRIKI